MPRKPARKRPGRKRISKAKQKALKRKKLKRTLSVAGLFIVSVLFLLTYFSYKELTSEYASAFSPSSYEILDRNVYSSAVIVVEDFDGEPVKVKEISLYIFDKGTLKLIKYTIPLQTEIDVPGRFGVEPFSHIFALGKMKEEDIDASAKLVVQAINKLFAFPVDRYLVVESRGEETVKALLQGKIDIINPELEPEVLKEFVHTNLSLKEIFDIYRFTNSLPGDRVIEKEISLTYLENTAALDEELKDLTFDSLLSEEQKSIAVLNASDIPGVAAFGSRLVENYGGRVVAIGNATETHEKSIIVTDDTTSESTRIISNLFAIENIVLKSESKDFPDAEISRSDITVILGLDFAGSL